MARVLAVNGRRSVVVMAGMVLVAMAMRMRMSGRKAVRGLAGEQAGSSGSAFCHSSQAPKADIKA